MNVGLWISMESLNWSINDGGNVAVRKTYCTGRISLFGVGNQLVDLIKHDTIQSCFEIDVQHELGKTTAGCDDNPGHPWCHMTVDDAVNPCSLAAAQHVLCQQSYDTCGL